MNLPRPRPSRSFAAALVVLLIGAGMAALIPLPGKLASSPVIGRVFDALHLPMFAFTAFAVHALIPAGIARRRRLLLTALISSSLAAAIELIQPGTGRSASWRDFVFGLIGIGLTLAILAGRRPFGAKPVFGFAIALAGSVAVVAWPVWNARNQIVQLRAAFPQLIPPQAEVSDAFWHPQGCADRKFSDQGAIHVDTRSGDWSGIHFAAGGQNWSQHDTLVLHLTGSAAPPFSLGLRIDDAASTDDSNRFHRHLEVQPGRQIIRIALADIGGAPLDLCRVVRLVLHTAPDDPPRSFTLERAFLE